jgi:hypothetical protein
MFDGDAATPFGTALGTAAGDTIAWLEPFDIPPGVEGTAAEPLR